MCQAEFDGTRYWDRVSLQVFPSDTQQREDDKFRCAAKAIDERDGDRSVSRFVNHRAPGV